MSPRWKVTASKPAFLVILAAFFATLLVAACSGAPAAAPPASSGAAAVAAPPTASAPAAPTTASAAGAPTTAPAAAAPTANPAVPTQGPAQTVGPLPSVTPSRPYKMAFANWAESVSFSVEVRKGMQAAAKKYGVDLLVLDNKQDVNQANINVNNVLTQKADFFFEYQASPEANVQIAQKLHQANMKAIAIQVPMPGYPFYVVDNEKGGFLGGQAGAQAAQKRWGSNIDLNMLVIGIPEAGPAFAIRDQGAIKGAQSVFPNVKVTEVSDKSDAATARQEAADYLTSHPTGKILIWTHVDQTALSVLSAVKAAGRENDVVIASLGGESVIFPELRNPNSIIVGTAAFFPERWGEDLIPLAIRWLNGGPPPPTNMNPPMEFLTRANIDKWYPNQ